MLKCRSCVVRAELPPGDGGVQGVEATDKLVAEFVPKAASPAQDQLPILQGIEVEREEVLTLGFAVPSFLLNDPEPERTGDVVIRVEGKPISAVLRLYNAGNPTGHSGQVRLVVEPWSEKGLIYATRPKLGEVVAKIGPTSCDGVNYVSREGNKPAELVVEYVKQ